MIRAFDFDDKSNLEIYEMKQMINKLLASDYTIEKISQLLCISKPIVSRILKYKYVVPPMYFERKSYFTESEMFEGTNNYSYDTLSVIEKAIYNNLK